MATKIKQNKIDPKLHQELEKLVDKAVEKQLYEYFGDPDVGLEIKEEVVERILAQRKAKKTRIPMEKVAKKYGFKLK